MLTMLLSIAAVSAQERLEMSESDGFEWIRVTDSEGHIGALDEDDSVLVPTRYCRVVYSRGMLVADSCAEDYLVGTAVFTSDGECIIPASREYLKVKPTHQKGADFLLVRIKMDRRTYWGVCDIYGNEVISPVMYADLMADPHSMFYYTEKGFAVKRDKKRDKFTYIGIFVDEDGRMYQEDSDGIRTYLVEEEEE